MNLEGHQWQEDVWWGGRDGRMEGGGTEELGRTGWGGVQGFPLSRWLAVCLWRARQAAVEVRPSTSALLNMPGV